jgi:hypothetical protein
VFFKWFTYKRYLSKTVQLYVIVSFFLLMDIESIISGLSRQLFSEKVISIIKKYENDTWMWRCSNERKRIVLERGAIQIGYTDYDDGLKIYTDLRN